MSSKCIQFILSSGRKQEPLHVPQAWRNLSLDSTPNARNSILNYSSHRKQQESSTRYVHHQKSILKRISQNGKDLRQTMTGQLISQSSKTAHYNRNHSSQPIGEFLKLCLLVLIILVLLIGAINCIVVYQVKFFSTTSGRADYALADDTIELSCHYTMKDEAEDVKQVVWSKDGKNFLRWRKNRPGLEVLSYLFKGHVDQNSTFSRLIIHNVTIAMHGKYICSVKTDLATHTGEYDLIVISSQQCKLNDWRIHSEQTKCRELFRFDCRNMFPKPVQSCGLWNDKLKKFIRSVTVDINEETIVRNNESSTNNPSGAKETYRIRYSDKYVLRFPNGSTNPQHSDLLQYAGHLVFKCDILVPDTKWNLSLSHKMFDYQDGCYQDPLEAIERMRLNFSQYAAQRMQQAGYIALKQQQQQIEEIEMLTTSLKYEIIPPSHFITGGRNSLLLEKSAASLSIHNGSAIPKSNITGPKLDNTIDLDCWQRPRVGSFAQLSCENHNKNQVKLVGANLLECRPNGWVPVRSSVTNIGEPSEVRKQQEANRKLFAIGSGRRSTRAERPDGQTLAPAAIDPNRIEGSSENDEDNDDSTGTDSNASRPSKEMEGPARMPDSHTSDAFEEKVKFENEILTKSSDYDYLAPADLAALLPTCVSITPKRPKKQHNRLPMIEASSARNDVRSRTKIVGNQNDYDNWNWYIFSSSSSSSNFRKLDKQDLIMISIVLLTTLVEIRRNAH